MEQEKGWASEEEEGVATDWRRCRVVGGGELETKERGQGWINKAVGG